MRLWNRIVRWWRINRVTLVEGKPLWLWLIVFALLFAAPYVFMPERADAIRWAGMFLQFAGLLTVFWGLNESRKLFDRPPFWRTIFQWLGRWRYLVLTPKPIHLTATGISAGAATVSGAGLVVSAPPGDSLESRVKRLEADLKRLEGDVAKVRENAARVEADAHRQIDQERNERHVEDQKISKQLETATIGGIQLEVAGVFYLFVGIAFTSIPEETARLLAWIGV